MTGYTFFSVELPEGPQPMMLGIAQAASAELAGATPDGGRVYEVPAEGADRFEQAIRTLVGSDDYRRYNRMPPGARLLSSFTAR
jgi:hypothetical protein